MIIYSKNAQKAQCSMDKRYAQHVMTEIDLLPFKKPQEFDLRKRKGVKDTYRIHIGEYRVIFTKKGDNFE